MAVLSAIMMGESAAVSIDSVATAIARFASPVWKKFAISSGAETKSSTVEVATIDLCGAGPTSGRYDS